MAPATGNSFREIAPAVEFQFTRLSTGDRGYAVELSAVTALELIIVPDISGGAARASLTASGYLGCTLSFLSLKAG
jgi:hypothetical protein